MVHRPMTAFSDPVVRSVPHTVTLANPELSFSIETPITRRLLVAGASMYAAAPPVPPQLSTAPVEKLNLAIRPSWPC